MPDRTGRLTAADKSRVFRWLQQRGTRHACPVCNHNNWTIADHLLTGTVHTEDARAALNEAYPQVALVCNHCAFVKYFMALPMGLGHPPRQD